MDAHLLYKHQNPRVQPTAPVINIGNLPRISRDSLFAKLIGKPGDESLAIIDVRDSDFIGGHIRGCQNVPAPSLDYRMPELLRTLREKKIVVFHCALSQQRGPTAALRYMRERERLGLDKKTEPKDEGNEEGENKESEVPQKVFVLEGGFQRWQEKYGEDERVTEGYDKGIWEFGQY
ncbi:Rhodanese-like protein [Microthyrium microscopicum]|uniref:Rhodanese-like protein n=1 Tax=Microthyrium microscopicum TaxID=703497 RepID=A0A6A6UQD6_9PEZI|nr:Rhodanese-like protein [Microthyrium microscopicum]